jgi:hypothetical protein
VQARPEAGGAELQAGGSVPGIVTHTAGGVARNIAVGLAQRLRCGCIAAPGFRVCKPLDSLVCPGPTDGDWWLRPRLRADFSGAGMLQPNLPMHTEACCQQTAQRSLAGASRKE